MPKLKPVRQRPITAVTKKKKGAMIIPKRKKPA